MYINLGAHVSIAESLDLAIDRGVALGCDSIQIFPGPPRAWLSPKYPDNQIKKFKEKRKKYKIKNVFIHAIYLVNLASNNKFIHERSYQSMLHAAKLQVQIGADGVIFHPGSFVGSSYQAGISAIARSIDKLLSEVSNAFIVLENSTGAGSKIGKSPQELLDINNLVAKKNKVGYCLDTCHLFASGFDFSNNENINKIIKLLTPAKIKAIHLNGSLGSYKSNIDNHSDIGTGELKTSWLKKIVSHPALADKPFILETPSLKKKISELSGLTTPTKFQKTKFVSRMKKKLALSI